MAKILNISCLDFNICVEQYKGRQKIKLQRVHIKFYKVISAPILTYGSENWALNKYQRRKIETAGMSFLRRVFSLTLTLTDHVRNMTIRNTRGLRHEMSSPAWTLGSWFRIPIETWMFVCVYSVFVLPCVSIGLATGWSLVQGVIPTVYKCKIKEPRKRRPRPDMGCKRHWMDGYML
jgi:hypothetical protein